MLKQAVTLMSMTLSLCGCSFLLPAKDLPDYSYERFDATEGPLYYRLLAPLQKEAGTNEKYPLVIVLHGAGERGSDNKKQLRNGGELFLGSNRQKFPATVVFPQAPRKESWIAVDADRSTRPFTLSFAEDRPITLTTRKLLELIEALKSRNDVDQNRIYLMGISMGAMGSYEILATKAVDFAATVAICGATTEATAKAIDPSMPLWAFHGEEDNIIDAQHSIDAVKWIKSQGGMAQLSLYPGIKHNSWVSAFEEPELLEWMFSKSR